VKWRLLAIHAPLPSKGLNKTPNREKVTESDSILGKLNCTTDVLLFIYAKCCKGRSGRHLIGYFETITLDLMKAEYPIIFNVLGTSNSSERGSASTREYNGH